MTSVLSGSARSGYGEGPGAGSPLKLWTLWSCTGGEDEIADVTVVSPALPLSSVDIPHIVSTAVLAVRSHGRQTHDRTPHGSTIVSCTRHGMVMVWLWCVDRRVHNQRVVGRCGEEERLRLGLGLGLGIGLGLG